MKPSFKGLMNEFINEALHVNKFTEDFDGLQFVKDRAAFPHELESASTGPQGVEKIKAALKARSVAIPFDPITLTPFPAEKAKLATAAIVEFDNQNPEKKRAARYLSSGAAVLILEELTRKIKDSYEQRIASNTASSAALVPVAGSSSSALKALSSADDGGNISLADLASGVQSKEQSEGSLLSIEWLEIVNALQGHFNQIAMETMNAFSSAEHVASQRYMMKDLAPEASNAQSKKKVAAHLTLSFVAPMPAKYDEALMPFWGRVVDKAVAATLPRSQTLPITSIDSSTPDAYLDSGRECNPQRTGFCPAWLVRSVAAAKKKDEKAEAGDQPAPKRSKKAAAPPKATHEIIFENFTVNVKMASGAMQEFAFQRPVLKELPTGMATMEGSTGQKHFFREMFDHDDSDLKELAEKPIKKEAKRNFILG